MISLFTSIPIERAIEIASKRLKEDDTLEERTCLTADEIIKLLEFCPSAAFLSCKGKYYRHCHGVTCLSYSSKFSYGGDRGEGYFRVSNNTEFLEEIC